MRKSTSFPLSTDLLRLCMVEQGACEVAPVPTDFNYLGHFCVPPPPNTSMTGSSKLFVAHSFRRCPEVQNPFMRPSGGVQETRLYRGHSWLLKYIWVFNNFTFISANDWGSAAFLWVTFPLLKEHLRFAFMGSPEFPASSHIKTHPWDFHLQTSETNAFPQGGVLRAAWKEWSYPDIWAIQMGSLT